MGSWVAAGEDAVSSTSRRPHHHPGLAGLLTSRSLTKRAVPLNPQRLFCPRCPPLGVRIAPAGSKNVAQASQTACSRPRVLCSPLLSPLHPSLGTTTAPVRVPAPTSPPPPPIAPYPSGGHCRERCGLATATTITTRTTPLLGLATDGGDVPQIARLS